jgi:hypothetical protein
MTQEVVVVDAPQPQQNMLQVLAEISSRPNIDPAVVRQLWELQREVRQDQAKEAFTIAFLQLKRACKDIRIKKDGKIVYKDGKGIVKFSRYDDIQKVVQPLLDEHGFAASFTYETITQPALKVITVMELLHAQGHSKEFRSVPLPPIDSSGGKTDIQGAGSVSSYGKRYTMGPALDLIQEGDDNDGSGQDTSPLSPEQVKTVQTKMAAFKISEAALLKWIGSPTVEEIPKCNYDKLVGELDRKGREKGLYREDR